MGKKEFVSALSEKGFQAGYSEDGVPTIFVNSVDDFPNVNQAIKNYMAESGFSQSFGITIPCKKDE